MQNIGKHTGRQRQKPKHKIIQTDLDFTKQFEINKSTEAEAAHNEYEIVLETPITEPRLVLTHQVCVRPDKFATDEREESWTMR